MSENSGGVASNCSTRDGGGTSCSLNGMATEALFPKERITSNSTLCSTLIILQSKMAGIVDGRASCRFGTHSNEVLSLDFVRLQCVKC